MTKLIHYSIDEIDFKTLAVAIRRADHVTPSMRKVGTNFANKQRSLSQYR
jgi:hypothetical protein